MERAGIESGLETAHIRGKRMDGGEDQKGPRTDVRTILKETRWKGNTEMSVEPSRKEQSPFDNTALAEPDSSGASSTSPSYRGSGKTPWDPCSSCLSLLISKMALSPYSEVLRSTQLKKVACVKMSPNKYVHNLGNDTFLEPDGRNCKTRATRPLRRVIVGGGG